MSLKEKYVQHKSLFESFISLYILNGLNLILPLVSLPYLLRVVGPANYGIYAFVYVIVQYVLLISNYGFDFSATKQIAQSKVSFEKISEIYHAVTLSRLVIAFISIGVLLVIAPLVFTNSIHYKLLWLGLGIVIGDIFVPTWLFQGLEKMRYLTIVNVVSKLLFTLMIFFVIKEASDFQYIILLNGFGSVMAGIISTIIVYKVLKIQFTFPSIREVKIQFKEGLAVFGSTLGMNLYRNSNIFILGLFVSDTSVGIYAAAEKIIKAIQSIVSPIAQALFPHMSSKFRTLTIQEGIKLLIQIVKKIAVLLLLLSITTFLFSSHIVQLMGGDAYIKAIPLIKILSLVVFFGGLNYLLGIVGLINLNRQKDFFWSVMISGTFSILLLLITVVKWENLAAVWSMVLSEVLLFGSCCFSIYKLYHRNNLNG